MTAYTVEEFDSELQSQLAAAGGRLLIAAVTLRGYLSTQAPKH
jgi:hypothetical protein